MATERTEDPGAVLAAAVAAVERREMEALLALADPEIVIDVPAAMPNGGTFRGHDEYRAWLGNWLDAWERFSIEVVELERVGERCVIASVIQRGTGRGSGIPVEMSVFYVAEVRAGRLTSLRLRAELELARETAHEPAGQRDDG